MNEQLCLMDILKNINHRMMGEGFLKHTILIIDDDEALALITSDMLEDYGYQVAIAKNSNIAYELLKENTYHLIILDINLPRETGFEVCRELRKISTIPIIFASARTSEQDRIIGLDLGGDDYLPKPYSLKELLSRVNALLRRTYGFSEQYKTYKIADVEIDTGTRVVKKAGTEISLSLKEFDLLSYMAEHKNKVINKETLLREVWGMYSEVEQSTISVHIRWLREKLEADPAHPIFIKTIWGVGYSLSDPGDGQANSM